MTKEEWWEIYYHGIIDNEPGKASNALMQIIKISIDDIYYEARRINNHTKRNSNV